MPERVAFPAFAAMLLGASAFSRTLHLRAELTDPRIAYAVPQLPVALLAAALFTLAAWLAYRVLLRTDTLASKPTYVFVAALAVLFCLFWAPLLVVAGFVQDDWMLLAAAAVRQSLLHHPLASWNALDSVDGNFRPLGTVLYFGTMYRIFGTDPYPFLAGNFVVNFLGVLVCFRLVWAMGYSRVGGAIAAALYLSRGLIYTESTWTSALGDSIVVLCGGLVVLALLRSARATGWAAAGWQVLAWILFAVATLAKQSSFAIPLIVAASLLLRPGVDAPPRLGRRLVEAGAALLVYGGTAAIVFLHARSLLHQQTPYPVTVTAGALAHPFSYLFWYLVGVNFTPAHAKLAVVLWIAGMVVAVAVGLLLWNVRSLWGPRPRDLAFLLVAAAASISLFAVLPTRNQPYYGTMFAFWISAAVGVALSSHDLRRADLLPSRVGMVTAVGLIVLGFVEVRLKQTGIILGGGYVSGTEGMARGKVEYRDLGEVLRTSPHRDVLVLVDTPGKASYYASMAMLQDPSLKRILVFDSRTRSFAGNDQEGTVPVDGSTGLSDSMAYNWLVPVATTEAARLLRAGDVLWVRFTAKGVRVTGPAGDLPRAAD